MEKILIATGNPAKLAELKKGLQPLAEKGIVLLSLKDLGITDEPEETGMTFRDNSLLKAKYYSQKSGLPVIADDGGFVIPSLNNEPGVKSNRWLGRIATDEELIDYTLKRLTNMTGDDRLAYLETCVCFYDPQTKESICIQERIGGRIADTPSKRRITGYPYRSLFIVSEFGKYYDELSHAEHEKVNHRLKAVHKLMEKMPRHLVK